MISGIGPSITYDSRDNQFAPRTGTDITLVGTFNFKDLGSDFTYNKWQFAANGYFPVTSTGTLAVNGTVCAVSKGGPFYDLCMYGQAGELRGYEMGRYRDRASWAAQLEWRQKLNEKFGAVWFAGVGGIAKSLGDLADTTMLPSAGMGVRYKASKETGINLRLDLAIGKDSQAIYFGIGEVF
jgi:outer membrane protein assembly factor BamA